METFQGLPLFLSLRAKSETHYSLKEMETLLDFLSSMFHTTQSETHYSLKEMETDLHSITFFISSSPVGNPLLSERDGNIINHIIPFTISLIVGNPLLSERDGNTPKTAATSLPPIPLSETHYSLKEMETSLITNEKSFVIRIVGNPLLSERDGNFYLLYICHIYPSLIVGNPLLSERDGNKITVSPVSNQSFNVGNPLLSERDGNRLKINCTPRVVLRGGRKPTTL